MISIERRSVDQKQQAIAEFSTFAQGFVSRFPDRNQNPYTTGYYVRIDNELNPGDVELLIDPSLEEIAIVLNGKRARASKFDFGNHTPYEPLLAGCWKLFTALEGNDAELDCSHWEAKSPMDTTFWTEYSDTVADYYKRMIHPTMIPLVTESLSGGDVVWDLFGGEGSFLDALYARTSHSDGEFFLMDLHAEQFRRSRSKKGVNVVSVDLADSDARQNTFASVPEPTVVTALGGLCRQVITPPQALEVASDVYDRLPQGGRFFVTGITPVALNADQFADIGFEVLHKSIPENLLSGSHPSQLYILEK
ncbi:MAG: hypothetical protein RLZZ455_761 [Candidatus Parcubacteria bacterium]|jgi:hypothetical protein